MRSEPSGVEVGRAHRWATAKLDGLETAELPFSFTYGSRPSKALLKDWRLHRDVRPLDGQKSEHTLRFSDPESGLVLRCVGMEYHDFPTVEWTLHFENTGVGDTPILENILALDTQFRRAGPDEFLLHHFKGYSRTPSDYAPWKHVWKLLAAPGWPPPAVARSVIIGPISTSSGAQKASSWWLAGPANGRSSSSATMRTGSGSAPDRNGPASNCFPAKRCAPR